MAYYTEEVDQWTHYDDYAGYEEVPYEHQLEEQLVEALDTHVQGSVNRALIKALQPYAEPLKNHGKCKFTVSLFEPSRLALLFGGPFLGGVLCP